MDGASAGGMSGTPHRALRAYVSSYVGYRHVGGLPEVHHGISSPTATVIVSFDEPLDVGWVQRPGGGRFWTLAAGMHTRAALIRTHQRQHGIQLALTPLGCRRLLGLPIGALAHDMVGHEEVPLGIGRDAHSRLQESTSWPARFWILDEVLLTMLRGSPTPRVHAAASAAWRHIEGSCGLMSIGKIAHETGWSSRHLSARFVAEYGVTPKEAARLFRFDNARRLAASGRPLAQIAESAGYADQAHLTREWRSFAGQSPTRTRAEQLSFVQDPPG